MWGMVVLLFSLLQVGLATWHTCSQDLSAGGGGLLQANRVWVWIMWILALWPVSVCVGLFCGCFLVLIGLMVFPADGRQPLVDVDCAKQNSLLLFNPAQ